MPDSETMLKERVRQLRKERHWSQEELARRAGTTLSTVRNIETGRTGGRIATLRALAAVFGTTVDALTDGPKPEKRSA